LEEVMSRSSTVDYDALATSLADLSTQQLVVRAALAKDRNSQPIHYRLEVLCAEQRDRSKNQYSFVHLEWDRALNPPEPDQGPFFRSRTLHHNVPYMIVVDECKKTLEYWKANVTGDGPRPYEQWLVDKPFVCVIAMRYPTGMHREVLHQESRPFLPFHGLFLGLLEAYVRQLKTLGSVYDTHLELRANTLRTTHRRFESFYYQAVDAQIQRVTA
jgi:hypothetical protein